MLVDLTEEDEGEGEETATALASTAAATAARADAARLRTVLLARGCCIVPVPAPLRRVLVSEQCCHHEVSPPLVRQLVREAKGVAYQQRQPRGRAGSGGLEPWPATQEDAQLLLVYCASDLVEKGDVSELDGLPLLPLADGSLGTLAVVGLQQGLPTYFLVGEAERPLFARGQHVLGALCKGCVNTISWVALPRHSPKPKPPTQTHTKSHTHIPIHAVLERERLLPKVNALLENDALMRPTNVARFAPPHLDAFLQAVLPLPFAEALEVAWRPGEVVEGRCTCVDGGWCIHGV